MFQVKILKVQKTNFVNYCYVVADVVAKTAILIDPAWEPHTIENLLNDNGWLPRAVLLTHHHPDHTHLAAYFAERFDIPVYMSEAETEYYAYTSCYLVTFLTELELIIDTIRIKPLATPGHTYGSVCYLIEQNLFTGDTLFNEGCGICFGKGADPYQLYASLQKLKSLPPKTIIYPGHSYGLPIGLSLAEILNYNLYLQFQDAETFVAFRMRREQGGIFNFK